MKKIHFYHGVFLEIFDVGVLLMGEAGIGKSELGLELISKGHQLIADDVIEFYWRDDGLFEGSSHRLLQDFMEVRGIGLLNIRTLFGDSAITYQKTLGLVIELQDISSKEWSKLDRLDCQPSLFLQDKEIPKFILGVGKSLVLKVEVIVRRHIQQQQGYHVLEDFAQRQQQAMVDQIVEL